MRSLRKTLVSITLILLLVGIIFKSLHWPGANQLLFMSAILAIFYVIVVVLKK